MKLLAIETSTMLGGVAIIGTSEGLIAESRLNVKTTHSERLMTEISHVMKQAGISIAEIDAFGVAIGPGSFTGLRIGVNTVKGLSYATGKPVAVVPTLEAFAWNFPYSPYPVCTMLDARKQEVYAAVFQWQGKDFIRLVSETSVRPAELVQTFSGTVIFVGEGAILYREAIAGIMGERALYPDASHMVPSPSNVASLCLKKALRGEYAEAIGLVPLYVRRSEAEVKRESAERDNV